MFMIKLATAGLLALIGASALVQAPSMMGPTETALAGVQAAIDHGDQAHAFAMTDTKSRD